METTIDDLNKVIEILKKQPIPKTDNRPFITWEKFVKKVLDKHREVE